MRPAWGIVCGSLSDHRLHEQHEKRWEGIHFIHWGMREKRSRVKDHHNYLPQIEGSFLLPKDRLNLNVYLYITNTSYLGYLVKEKENKHLNNEWIKTQF